MPTTMVVWNRTLSVPQFDPDLGTLNSVTFTMDGNITGTAFMENKKLDGPNVITALLTGTITLTRPGGQVLVVTIPISTTSRELPLFDGTVDYGGTSGLTLTGLTASDSQFLLTSAPDILSEFSGTGSVLCPVGAVAASKVTDTQGNAAMGVLTNAGAAVTVVYDYTPAPPGSIGDFVWEDSNGDGVWQTGEPGIKGVTVELVNASNQVIATDVTDSNGLYLFENLLAGTYTVRVVNSSLPLTSQAGWPLIWTQTYDLTAPTNDNAALNVPLAAGENRRDVDFGYTGLELISIDYSLGNRVWFDNNDDGVQDADEPGIPDVTVTLTNTDTSTSISILTDADGYYIFANLTEGDYTVTVSGAPLAGLIQTYDLDGIGVGSEDTAAANLPADPPAVDDESTDTARLDVDFGYYRPEVIVGSIGDYVWKDLDADKVQDPAEWGLNDKHVTLYVSDGSGGWTFVAQTTTAGPDGAKGRYLFSNLPLATYAVVVSSADVASYTQTYDLNGPLDHAAIVTLTESAPHRLDVDFGYTCSGPCKGSIGDYVWKDTDGEGYKDCGESGIAGVKLTLTGISGIPLGTATTNSSGYYLISNLSAGTYTVTVDPTTLPEGLVQTYDLDGLATPHTATAALASGQNRRDVDFGYRCGTPPTGSIGDYVYKETSCGKSGIPGVTVFIKNAAGVTVGTTTNSSGKYLFSNLPAGTYTVTVDVSTLPAGVVQTYDLDGLATANTATASLAAGQNRTDVDFGYKCGTPSTPFTTYTQGGWGSCPKGNNPGALLQAKFCQVLGSYVKIGTCGTKYLKFTSAGAVSKFLPQGGTPGVLKCSATNPTRRTAAGVFAGQVLALKLNVEFSAKGVTRTGLARLHLTSGALKNWDVAAVLDLANKVLGGQTSYLPSGLSISGLNDIVTAINENYDGGTVDNGYLR